MASKQKNYAANKNLRNFFRLAIVFLTWFVSALVPSNSTGFYQSIFVASITSLYEYVIIYLDNIHDRVRYYLSFVGIILSALYLFLSFLGFSKLVMLDLEHLQFSLSNTFPIPNADAVKWSYYWTIYPMIFFPGIVIVEFFIKNESQKARIPSRREKKQKEAI
jgi:hypothetical protein